MAKPHVCPKCDGEKVVENCPWGMSSGLESHRPCPTCQGEGVVWDRQCPAPGDACYTIVGHVEYLPDGSQVEFGFMPDWTKGQEHDYTDD